MSKNIINHYHFLHGKIIIICDSGNNNPSQKIGYNRNASKMWIGEQSPFSESCGLFATKYYYGELKLLLIQN